MIERQYPNLPLCLIATTTSTVDTGLLHAIKPRFAAAAGYELCWRSLGTGAAIQEGCHGRVDALFVHAQCEEYEFMSCGPGRVREHIMFNEFIVVGPDSLGSGVISEIFQEIYDECLPFASRGDNSGTHIREMQIWNELGVNPFCNPNYYETGLGMLLTLEDAAMTEAYCLTDDGTWIRAVELSVGEVLERVSSAADPQGLNQYGVISIKASAFPTPSPCHTINEAAADAFIAWLLSPAGRRCIRRFRIAGAPGMPVFTYNAHQTEPDPPFSCEGTTCPCVPPPTPSRKKK